MPQGLGQYAWQVIFQQPAAQRIPSCFPLCYLAEPRCSPQPEREGEQVCPEQEGDCLTSCETGEQRVGS